MRKAILNQARSGERTGISTMKPASLYWESIGGTMRSKTLASLGILLGLAISPAFAQVDRVADSRPTGIMTPLAPIHPDRGNAADGRETSANSGGYAGYVVTGSAFTSVKGSWVVPKYHCLKTPNSGSGFAVGFDGYDNSYFEVIGTASNCVGTQYQYYAVYEFSPTDYGFITSVPVKSGDLEVSYTGSKFKLTITNKTTGKTFSKSAAVPGAPRDSADWIVTTVGGFSNLMDFGTLSSGDDYTTIVDTDWATDSTVSGPISDFGSKLVKLNMVNSANVTLATPSALTTDGSSFTVTWKHE